MNQESCINSCPPACGLICRILLKGIRESARRRGRRIFSPRAQKPFSLITDPRFYLKTVRATFIAYSFSLF